MYEVKLKPHVKSVFNNWSLIKQRMGEGNRERKLTVPSWPAMALVRGWPIRSQPRHPSLGPGLVLQSPWAQAQLRPAGWMEDESGISFLYLDLTAYPWVQWSNLPWPTVVICPSNHSSIHSPSSKQGS